LVLFLIHRLSNEPGSSGGQRKGIIGFAFEQRPGRTPTTEPFPSRKVGKTRARQEGEPGAIVRSGRGKQIKARGEAKMAGRPVRRDDPAGSSDAASRRAVNARSARVNPFSVRSRTSGDASEEELSRQSVSEPDGYAGRGQTRRDIPRVLLKNCFALPVRN